VFLKLPLGMSNQHMIEKIAVITEKSDSSYESESSVDISEDEELGSCRNSQKMPRMVYLMMPQNTMNSDGSFNMHNLSNKLRYKRSSDAMPSKKASQDSYVGAKKNSSLIKLLVPIEQLGQFSFVGKHSEASTPAFVKHSHEWIVDEAVLSHRLSSGTLPALIIRGSKVKRRSYSSRLNLIHLSSNHDVQESS